MGSASIEGVEARFGQGFLFGVERAFEAKRNKELILQTLLSEFRVSVIAL